MQTFEQWWNEIEGYGVRAERFTTPGDAAKAAWDQAMSLRAQADARPVAWMDDGSTRNGSESTSYRVVTDATKRNMPSAAAQAYTTPLYTHPKASAPGLSEDAWLALAERHIKADWNSDEPDGYLNAVKALVQDAMLLTRASAATVGEAKMPDTSDDPVNLLHRVLTIAGFSSEDAEYQKLTDALAGAAQQQAEPTTPMEVLRVTYAPDMSPEEFARMWPKFKVWQQAEHVGQACGDSAEHVGIQQAEPGADEKTSFETWARSQRYDMAQHPLHYLFLNERTYAARQGWKAALKFAAQSGQRAGVAEGWQLVPKEPTQEMIDAMGESVYGYPRSQAIEWAKEEKFESCAHVGAEAYRAAIAAAPTQQQEGGK
ncbi:hypothetical protein GO299_04718 [Ralstonia solanacearum]|nr:hypothetical protein [Ralstonia solanacearum]NKF72410.1 hypothetical protein [Ralstonia solanacearum]